FLRPPPRSPLFPYTTLFRSRNQGVLHVLHGGVEFVVVVSEWLGPRHQFLPLVLKAPHHETQRRQRVLLEVVELGATPVVRVLDGDRKSTRLNSSHRTISYAV